MRLLALVLLLSTAHAGEPGHWRINSALQFRTNRLGLGLLTYSGYQVKLYDSDSLLLSGAYAEAGVVTQLSPASFHPGVYAQIAPVTPLVFRFAARKLGFFGLFGTVVEYEDATSAWSPEALDANEPKAEGSIGTAWEATGQLRLKFGPVLALHEQSLLGVRMDSISEGNFWYESVNDLLVARNDRIHIMKTTLAGLIQGSLDTEFLVVGAHWETYEAQESGSKRQILGLAGLYRPDADWWGKPTAAVLVGVMLEDKYRQWEPYLGGQVGITLESTH